MPPVDGAPGGASLIQNVVAVAEGAALLPAESRFKRYVSFGIVAAPLLNAGWSMWKRRNRAESWSVVVPDTDDLYADLHHWVLSRIPESERRAVSVRSGQSHQVTVDGDEAPARPVLQFLYDSTKEVTVDLDGHPVTVAVEREEAREGGWGSRIMLRPERIRFTADDLPGRRAIEAFLHKVIEARTTERKPRLYTARWGAWQTRNDLSPRPLSTVALPKGVIDEVVADVERFLAAESTYARLGWLWHRGILLQGPPRNGKTSLARGLGTHFGMDVYLLALADVENDTALFNLVGAIRERSILLVEDIDTVVAVRDRDREEEVPERGVTLSGLLQVFDGVVSPHGLVLIPTTNRRGVLDPALIGPGRIDLDIYVGNATAEQANQIVALVFPEAKVFVRAVAEDVPTAAISEACKRALDDPSMLMANLKDAGCEVMRT